MDHPLFFAGSLFERREAIVDRREVWLAQWRNTLEAEVLALRKEVQTQRLEIQRLTLMTETYQLEEMIR